MPDDTLPLALILITMAGVGALAGFIAGLLGVGGGIVVVPALFWSLGMVGVPEAAKMHIAVATSLATLVPTAISSMRAHHRRGAVDVPLLKSWGPWITVGVVLGGLIASSVKGAVLTGVFGSVVLLVALYMSLARTDLRFADDMPHGIAKIPLCLMIGGVSTMMGIGGGSLSVPTMALCNYPIKRAVGTASAIGMIIGLPGVVTMIVADWHAPDALPYSLGYVSLIGFLLIAPLQTLAAPLGARVAHAINPTALRRVFALFLALTGVRMLVRTVAGV